MCVPVSPISMFYAPLLIAAWLCNFQAPFPQRPRPAVLFPKKLGIKSLEQGSFLLANGIT